MKPLLWRWVPLKKHLSTFINGVSRKSKQKKKHKWEKTGVPVFFLLEMIRWGTEEKAEQKRTEERANAVRPYGYDVFSQSVILSKAKNRPASSTRSVQNTVSLCFASVPYWRFLVPRNDNVYRKIQTSTCRGGVPSLPEK